ncbi:MAG: helix-turn-helix transcriptional regulator [Sphingomonas sp.]|uniref:helix-turn-helix domain-containing protein n=1 Tax=Sphingomonas sp. TaxID=28214 RepID=UPI001B1D51C8|nr:AraC family transcriptional regulator [Sphingomonas sp.]MBO9621587.1 helix-turn-helix transcriptional regulator [Sphingomonas sp.]
MAPPASLRPTTIVRRGSATELALPTAASLSGGALQVSRIEITQAIEYSQHSERHLLHVTLDGGTGRSACRVGSAGWTGAPDRRGSISFTPNGVERECRAGTGLILGAQFELDEGFVEDACEQALHARWRHGFNVADPKIFAIAEAIAKNVTQGTATHLALDMLQLALARQVAGSFAGAERRRDDGWLHPRALARVIEQLDAEPAQRVTLNVLARTAGLGVSAFVRAFRGTTGETPAAFALRLRLGRAEELVRRTDLGLREIAERTGFASAAHFVRTYRAHRGVTPGQLRLGGAGPSRAGNNRLIVGDEFGDDERLVDTSLSGRGDLRDGTAELP